MAIDENKINKIITKSEFFQDILDKVPSRIAIWGGSTLFLIFILICLGLNYIKYPDVISSEVVVTTEIPPIEVYSKVSGRIIKLLKNDQENVKKNDWIIVLNSSANYHDVQKADKIIKTIDPNDFWKSINQIDLQESLILGDIQSSYFEFSKSVQELQLFTNLNFQYRQLDINSRRKENLMSLTQKLTNQLSTIEKELAIFNTDYERTMKLQNEGFVAKAEVEQKEIAYLNMVGKVEELKGSLFNTQIQMNLIEKENTSLDIEKNDTYFKLRSNVFQFYNNLLFQLSEWQNKYILSAPMDGTLNLYEIRSTNQFLVAEQKAFTITSDKPQNYFAIIKLPVANSGKVRVGQNCIIQLHNYPYTEFGMLKGFIQSVSGAAKEGFYSVRVKLLNQLCTTTNKTLDSKGDFNGIAKIIIEDLTLFDYILNIFNSKKY